MILVALILAATTAASPPRLPGSVIARGSPSKGFSVAMAVMPSTWRMAAEVARRTSQEPLEIPWQQWVNENHAAHCEPFRGGSELPDEPVYWTYRCSAPREWGVAEAEGFLVDRDSVPTVERLRWCWGPHSGLPDLPIAEFADSVARTLRRDAQLERRGVNWHDGSWILITEFPTSSGVLRLLRGDTLDDDTRDSLVLEHSSRRLEDALAQADRDGGPYEPDQEVADSLTRAEQRSGVERALQDSEPALATALAAYRSRAADAAIVAAALERASAPGVPRRQSHAVRWAVHVWGRGLRVSPADPIALGMVARAMSRTGCECGLEVDEGSPCWNDSLVEQLASTPDEDTWTRRAFLDRMESGWQAPCVRCGWEEAIGPDLFAPTIARGEAFVRDYPASPLVTEVLWHVAETHETAWSLSLAKPGDEYIESGRYLLDAPRHRERAIALYEQLLEREPDGPRLRTTINRLRRLKLNVDTNYHRYWCVWD